MDYPLGVMLRSLYGTVLYHTIHYTPRIYLKIFQILGNIIPKNFNAICSHFPKFLSFLSVCLFG